MENNAIKTRISSKLNFFCESLKLMRLSPSEEEINQKIKANLLYRKEKEVQ